MKTIIVDGNSKAFAEIIKIDIENDNLTLQEFSKMSYFSLSPKGKVLQNILDIVMKEIKE